MEKERFDWKSALVMAGAYGASIMGAGFATGQELLQFFSAQGVWSIVGVLVSTLILSVSGSLFMKHGREYGLDRPEAVTRFYFGDKCARWVEAAIEVFLYCVFFLMISGSGTILSEFFGFSLWGGRIFMTSIIFLTSALGLKRFSEVLGLLGPVLIGATLFTGAYGALHGSLTLPEAQKYVESMDLLKTGGGWFLSSVLYPSFNAVTIFYFLCAAGHNAKGRREVVFGGVVGGLFLGLSILLMNLGFLLNITLVGEEEIPSVILAGLVGPGFKVFFSVLICVAIYGVSIPSLWSVARHFGEDGSRRALAASFVMSLLALFLSLTDFRKLVNVLYPISGYVGILLMVLLVYREYQSRRKGSEDGEA